MLAYNLNCWLMLFNREPQDDATALQHTTLATSRLRFLFVAAKVWRHAGRTGVSVAITTRRREYSSGSWTGCERLCRWERAMLR